MNGSRRNIVVAACMATCAIPGILPAQSAPPVAARRDHAIVAPGGEKRDDPYFWLRDDTRKSPEVLNFIAAENRYADHIMQPLRPLEQKLRSELSGRIAPTDREAPYESHGYWYYKRFSPGKDYPIIARRKGTMQAPEEILLDEPQMAADSKFFNVEFYTASPASDKIAWTEDRVGRLQYGLKIKDLGTGHIYPEVIPNVAQDFVWVDNNTLLYIDKDPVTLLNKTVKLHTLGTPVSKDQTIYTAPDTSFYITVKRTADDRYVCIDEHSFVSYEAHCGLTGIPLHLSLFAGRENGVRYEEDHIGDRWVISTDWQAPNGRLMTVPDSAVDQGKSAWHDLVPASNLTVIEGFKPFKDFIAIEERSNVNRYVRLLGNDGRSRNVASDEPAYVMTLGTNEDAATPWLRYTYSSLTTPLETFEINALTGARRLVQSESVPGYDKSHYVTQRVWATARDGTRIPVTLLYRKGFKPDGKAAMLQYAYGSYGAVFDPYFQSYAISLADRGIIFAIAHVRGGGDLGRAWYDAGHLLHKMNTFTDFIDVTHYLVAHGYADKMRVGAYGASAGGLLMGGIANMAPQDYRVIIAHAPYVDAVTTMLDPTIPLVANEYDEWGNPAKPEDYDYMLSYSPYDNVAPRVYPAMFVSTALFDSQVQYYEPTKWVAKLQANNTGQNPILLRTDLAASHGGRSGRFGKTDDQAEFLAFLLHGLGFNQ